MYWQTVLSRLSIPGFALLLLGAVLCLGAPKFLKGRERAAILLRFAGLALAVLGALILLDFIPGL